MQRPRDGIRRYTQLNSEIKETSNPKHADFMDSSNSEKSLVKLFRVRQIPINENLSACVRNKNDRSVNKYKDSGSPSLDRKHSTVVMSANKFGLLKQIQIGFHSVDRDPRFISDNVALDCCKRLVVNAFGLKFHERSSLGDIG